MKKLIHTFVIMTAALLTACSSNTPPPVSGKAIPINAHKTSILENGQDKKALKTQSLPTSTSNKTQQNKELNQIVDKKKPKKKAKPVIYTHFVYQGEPYQTALNRWLKREPVKHVAWSISKETQQALSQKTPATLKFAGNIESVLTQLAKHVDTQLLWGLESYTGIAAIHQFKGRQVQLSLVNGSSLKAAIASLSADYNWKWQDSGKDRSWLAEQNFSFSSSYPIVTPKYDFEMALMLVLEGYPVSAQLLDSTQSVFIVDKR